MTYAPFLIEVEFNILSIYKVKSSSLHQLLFAIEKYIHKIEPVNIRLPNIQNSINKYICIRVSFTELGIVHTPIFIIMIMIVEQTTKIIIINAEILLTRNQKGMSKQSPKNKLLVITCVGYHKISHPVFNTRNATYLSNYITIGKKLNSWQCLCLTLRAHRAHRWQ